MLTTDNRGRPTRREVNRLGTLSEVTHGVLTVNADTRGRMTARMMKGFMAG